MQLSLCLEMLYPDLSFTERMKTAAALGYRAFEFWDWRDKDLQAVNRTALENSLAVAAMSGNRRYTLLDPDDRAGLLEEMMQVFAVAQRLHCHNVMMLTDVLNRDGSAAPTRPLSKEAKIASIVAGLSELAGWARDANITLLLEPLNTVLDHRGCFLDSSELGINIVKQVNHPNVQLLYDIYHLSMMGEDVLTQIEKHRAHIGYIHVADMPGRHQPGTGTIDYAAVNALLRRIGYSGFVGMEFSAAGEGKAANEAAAQAPLEVFA
jgi:hydroxypyruvate isomerase